MNIKHEIIDFIKRKENNGALLLTGKWGCGKTYLIRDISDELNKKGDQFVVVCVSLFGVDSISALNHKIKENIFGIITAPRLSDSSKKLISKIKNTTNNLALMLSDYSSIAKGINAALSVNLYDLIDIKQFIECKQSGEDKKRELVLVFDDFERSKLSVIDLLGTINDYSENKHIKTIIVADEEKISEKDTDNNQYQLYKEKLITRTLKLSPNYGQIINNIVNNYNETTKGYKSFLQHNSDLLVKLFCDSHSENIRTLKTLLIDFERIFVTWDKTDVSKEYMSYVLYSFGAVSFEFKSGNYNKSEYGYLFADNEVKKKYSLFNSLGSNLISLRLWITDGLWNEDEFISEIKGKYCPDLLTHDQKFILYDFWDLQQEDIDQGLPVAVDNAYKGELSRDDLISLLKKIHALRENNIKIPCNIDYSKIESGLEIRKNRIRSGTIIEPAKRTFTTDDQIDTEAVSINHGIEAIDDLLHATSNRTKYITYLQHKENIQRYDIKGIAISSFDDNLLHIFIEEYRVSDNSSKRELALSLIGLNFADDRYSSNNEIAISIANLTALSDTLDQISKNESDQISIAINMSFVKEIKQLISRLKETLHMPLKP
jgi:flagellar biosynthesis regulator FlaF